MPEAPECRIITEGLRKELTGNLVTHVTFLSGRYVTHGVPEGFGDWHASLPQECLGVGVKGKFIHLLFDGWSVWNTLGMSGIWLKHGNDYGRMCLDYTRRDDSTGQLFFSDIRNYGTLKFVRGRAALDRKLASLGLDHLNDAITPEMTLAVLMRKRNIDRTLAEVLMDQSSFAGVGNYCKAEILWRCRLSPHRTPRSLTDGDRMALHDNTIAVLREAYEHNGMVLSDYASLYGKGAGFDDERSGVFERQCYGRKRDALGNEVVMEETKDGRTTHWAPAIQR